MSHLDDGDWMDGAGCIILILILLAQWALLAFLTHLTRKEMALREWDDEYLISDEEAFAPAENTGLKQKVLDQIQLLQPQIFLSTITTSCARHTLAYEQRVNSDDLKTLFRSPDLAKIESLKTEGGASQQSQLVDRVVAQGTDAVAPIVEAFFGFVFLKRVWILYLALNAWLSLRHFSFSLPSSMRGLLLVPGVIEGLGCSI
eukprot:1727271-Amphidinium_carterae.2